MASNSASENIDQIKKDFDALRSDVLKLTESIKDTTGKKVQAGAEQAKDSASQVRQSADEAVGKLGKEIENKPFSSVLAALGIGYLIGLLLHRR